ncbi:MAG TPA: NTP transferase domain-containing protein [Desulfobacterales bacterium]|nr:NTP transferase domain-containing protein [Desulfobacterales bacterium]
MRANLAQRADRAAIILAAGASRRMGQSKPLMVLGRETVLNRVVRLYQEAGLTDIRVITGFGSEAIQGALAACPVAVIHNPAHESGMFTSVLAGVNTLSAAIGSFFIHPVDIPLVRPHTLTRLMERFDEGPATVIYPVFDGQRGHPPLIHAALKQAMVQHDGREGLRALLTQFERTAQEVPVADGGVLLDMDTPEDWQHLCARWEAAAVLTEDECRVLMEQVQELPPALVEHCRLVAAVAGALANAVAQQTALDIPLIQAAARVHDLARRQDNHAAAAASLLKQMGFAAMAAIVAVHMDMPVCQDGPLDEAQIVFLADKLVAGNRVARLERRFAEKLKNLATDPAAAAAITRRRDTAVTIQHKVERACGDSLERILARAGIVGRGHTCDRP